MEKVSSIAFVFGLIGLTYFSAADTTTIASAAGTPPELSLEWFSQVDSQPQTVTWTQSQAYTNVSISVTLGGSGFGYAYLTTSLGPGTGLGSEIAEANFFNTETQTDNQLFNSLTLPAGTYYLTLYRPHLGVMPCAWAIMPLNSVTFTAAPGVTIGPSLLSSHSLPTFGVYPPSDDSFNAYAIYSFLYSVTSTPIPEPFGVAGVAGGIVLLLRRRGLSAPVTKGR